MISKSSKLFQDAFSVRDDDLIEVKKPCSREITEYFKAFHVDLPGGYKTEANLRIKDWLSNINNKLDSGFVLTIDYGYPSWEYYSEERSRGTLLCYHQHQINENPYQHIGEQDLTTHVNFSSLKRYGEDWGIKTIGFCPQGTYIVSLGIDEVIREIYGDLPDPFEIAKIKGLILPQGMGESHKIMIQYKGDGDINLRGFNLRNQMQKL
ncbi:MAG: SAM-dependent methyltransferase [Nitrospirae bacterium]|nr:SAM-dependent methyltransferase [Nitrospirota bacterium]